MPRLTLALATLLALTASRLVAAQEAAPTFPNDAYVQVKDGHLACMASAYAIGVGSGISCSKASSAKIM